MINAGEVVVKRELSYSLGGNANWYSHCGEQYRGSLNQKQNGLHHSEIPLLGTYSAAAAAAAKSLRSCLTL